MLLFLVLVEDSDQLQFYGVTCSYSSRLFLCTLDTIKMVRCSIPFCFLYIDTAVVPEIWEAFYGDVVNFTCNTSLSEVFWTEDGRSVRGNSTSVDGWTISVYQATVTKNATVSCFAEPAEDEFDTAQIILLEG